jgi:hypothetical protein
MPNRHKWVQSRMTAHEIRCGEMAPEQDFWSSIFGFTPVIDFFHCYILISHTPVRYAIALTRQHIITSSVSKLGASYVIRNSAGCRGRRLSLVR